MLRSMRDGAKQGILKYLLFGLLVFAGGGLVLTDVGGFFRGGIGSTDVAKAGNIRIGFDEFNRAVQRALSHDQISPQQAYQMGIIDNFLSGEINGRLFALKTRDLGIRVGDEELLKQIDRVTQNLATDEGTRKEAIQRILRQNGITEAEFISSLRQETETTLIRNSLLFGTGVIPKEMVETLYRFQNETRDLEVIHFNNDEAKPALDPTEENLSTYYEANKFMFAVPETRDLTIATLKNDALIDKIDITDEELKQRYESTIASFAVEETRTLEQSIFEDKAKAQAVYEQVKAGKALKQASLDVGQSDKHYLGEDEFEQSGLLEEIAQPVFAASSGDTLEPIQTPLGWHIIKVNGIKAPETIPFEDVKKDLKEELLQERLIEDMAALAATIDDRLAAGEPLETVVAESGLSTETFAAMNEAGMNKDKKDLLSSYGAEKRTILDIAFSLNQEEIAPIEELNDGRFIVIRADSITPQSTKPFEEVKDEIRQSWIADQKALANEERAKAAKAKLDAGEEWGKLSKELSLPIKKYSAVNARKPEGVALPYNALQQAFSVAEGQTAFAQTEEGFALIRVNAIRLPDIASASKDDIGAADKLTREGMPREIVNQYIASASKEKKVKINRALLDKAYSFPRQEQ